MSGTWSCAADKYFDNLNTKSYSLIYYSVYRPQSKSGVPTIHMQRQMGNTYFCPEA